MRVFGESLTNKRLKGSGKMSRFESFGGANYQTTVLVPCHRMRRLTSDFFIYDLVFSAFTDGHYPRYQSWVQPYAVATATIKASKKRYLLAFEPPHQARQSGGSCLNVC